MVILSSLYFCSLLTSGICVTVSKALLHYLDTLALSITMVTLIRGNQVDLTRFVLKKNELSWLIMITPSSTMCLQIDGLIIYPNKFPGIEVRLISL